MSALSHFFSYAGSNRAIPSVQDGPISPARVNSQNKIRFLLATGTVSNIIKLNLTSFPCFLVDIGVDPL